VMPPISSATGVWLLTSGLPGNVFDFDTVALLFNVDVVTAGLIFDNGLGVGGLGMDTNGRAWLLRPFPAPTDPCLVREPCSGCRCKQPHSPRTCLTRTLSIRNANHPSLVACPASCGPVRRYRRLYVMCRGAPCSSGLAYVPDLMDAFWRHEPIEVDGSNEHLFEVGGFSTTCGCKRATGTFQK
jgi:hypothetical protein